jgi:integrase
MKLTQRRIGLLQCPAGKKDVLVFDGEQKGLGVRVMASGAKTYLAQYSLAGAKRRVPLGSCDAISLAAAREATTAIMGDVAKGRDPAADRKQAAQEAKRKAAHDALTLEALLEQWDTLHLADRRERYRAEAVRAIKIAFASNLKVPAADLSRSTVVRVLDSLARQGKHAMASRTAAYGRAAYHWAVKRGSLNVNPFADLPQSPQARRERVLSDDELYAVWRATEEPGPFNAIVRMLILTGQRREEVAGMAWDELAPDLSIWTIPAARAKNGAAHLVPLSHEAQALLRAAPRLEGANLVFPGERCVFSGWSKSKDRLDQRSCVSGWTLHDLRRTLATGLQKLGIRLEVTEAVLNHIAGSRAGIVGVYQRHHWAKERRAALAAWGVHVAAIVQGCEARDNVTPIRVRSAQEDRFFSPARHG